MDAIVLAAGRGTRVAELAHAFHKPLLPIDGVPLVCRAVDLAHRAGVDVPVVVVAPENAESISGTLGDREVSLIIQRQPRGPGHALLVGLTAHTRPVPSDRVLVLLSDNVSTDSDVSYVTQHETAVGVKKIDHTDAERFTRYEDGVWIEKKPLPPDKITVIPCWVGPFVGWRTNMERKLHAAYEHNGPHRELLIGPYLTAFMKDPTQPCRTVDVTSYDVGTLDSYPRNGETGERR